jgi:uncharacterized membrane protein YkoI
MSTKMKGIVTILLATTLAMALSATAFAGTVTGKDALKTALADAGFTKSQVSSIEIDQDKKAIEIEFVCKKNKAKYEYDIAKSDGSILEKGIEYAYKHNASKAKVAKKAVLKKAAKRWGVKYSVVKKKAKVTYKYKTEGRYKVALRYQGKKYKCELLAPTGKIIEWEIERIAK